jgi:hypothetical protein
MLPLPFVPYASDELPRLRIYLISGESGSTSWPTAPLFQAMEVPSCRS